LAGKRQQQIQPEIYEHERLWEQDSMFLAAKGYIEKTYDYVIFGHSHKKSVSPYKGGYYINLGSWLEQPCYGAFYNKKFEVLDWKENVTRI
jgi:UDP-2,3-diacylglucosamine hydrolase